MPAGCPCSATRCTTWCAPLLRLGRISYANMAPVFYELDGEGLEQVSGVPTTLNRMLMAGEIDVAPISSIEYARHADTLRLLPRLCVSTEGAVDSIQLITRKPIEQVRSVAVTPESATSVVLTRVLLGEVELVPLDQPADARMLIGDAALQSAFDDPTPHYDLGRLWQERTGLPMVYAVWACRQGVEDGLEELERAHLRALAVSRSEPEALARRASAEYGWPAGFLARYFEKLRYHFGPPGRGAGHGAGAALRAGRPYRGLGSLIGRERQHQRPPGVQGPAGRGIDRAERDGAVGGTGRVDLDQPGAGDVQPVARAVDVRIARGRARPQLAADPGAGELGDPHAGRLGPALRVGVVIDPQRVAVAAYDQHALAA